MYKLLGRQTSGNVQKVLFMFEEMGADYEREDYGRLFENTQTAEYKALNPTSKVPTLVHGDVVIWESNTILRYLAAVEGAQFTGANPAEVSLIERWMDFLLAAVNAPYLGVFKGAKLAPEERGADFAEHAKALAAQLAIIDGHLDGKPFFALDRLTIVDIACAPVLKRCVDFKVDRPAFPNLERWVGEMAERPAFKTATGAGPKSTMAA